jgi:hypothetical protein
VRCLKYGVISVLIQKYDAKVLSDRKKFIVAILRIGVHSLLFTFAFVVGLTSCWTEQ